MYKKDEATTGEEERNNTVKLTSKKTKGEVLIKRFSPEKYPYYNMNELIIKIHIIAVIQIFFVHNNNRETLNQHCK